MPPGKDIRSEQRFSNFLKAFSRYEEANRAHLSRLEEEGLIQRFEYTFELAWKCLQDLLAERGYANVRGPRPVIEQAFQDGIISDGAIWLEMLRAQNESTHLYEESTFERISKQVKSSFFSCLRNFREQFPKAR